MNTREFLEYLESLNIQLKLNGSKLKLNAPAGVLTPSLKTEIAERKSSILSFLKSAQVDTEQFSSIPLIDRSTENLNLSFTQQRLWFLMQLEPDISAYNTTRTLRLTGSLNLEALNKSFLTILERHETLRTNFVAIDGVPQQVVGASDRFAISMVDLRDRDSSDGVWQSIIKQESSRPFDLNADLMLRVTLICLHKEEHILHVTIHHIASDGWSMGIFMKELSELYNAYVHDQPNPIPALPIQYVDFAAWQRAWLSGEVLESQVNYWKEHLAGAPPLLDLPTDYPRPSEQSYKGTRLPFTISKSLTDELKKLSQKSGVSLFMTLLTAFKVLLYRYTQQKDIVVGTQIANRNRQELENMMGFFSNTLALRTNMSDDPSFADLLKSVRQTTLDAFAHQDIPFEKLVEELQPERNLSYSPIVQAMFVLQNTPQLGEKLGELELQIEQFEYEASRLDLTLFMVETVDGLSGMFEYSTELFAADTIERMVGHLETLLQGIVINPKETIQALPLLTTPERDRLLMEWNDTKKDYPRDKCIHQLFEEQVERTPDSIAVVFQDRQVTYGELNERANCLAYYLQSLNVRPHEPVAICVDRSIEMIVGILGILKAGAAHIPLDPLYPKDRIAYILANSHAQLLITESKFLDFLPQDETQVICLDRDRDVISQASKFNPNVNIPADSLAYVIYTSGSTGNPKGVQVCHRSQTNLINHLQHSPGLSEEDTVFAVTTICFDTSTADIFLPLSVGAKIVVVGGEVIADGRQLLSELIKSEATFMQATPATWRLLLYAGWESSPKLRIVSTGEALPRQLAETLMEKVECLWDLYGPTEITVWATGCKINDIRKFSTYQPALELIGKPIANTQTYILDENLQPVPIGIRGELYIGGDGVAQGYLNRPDLTRERFINNPFINHFDSSYIYKTGDLARYLPDGNIEYLGRIDNQVKIRGFRIELGEIEKISAQFDRVKQSVVIVREDIPGDKRLVAYVVPQQENKLNINDLSYFLKEQLPHYMVPSHFVVLETIPLTPNGKINRRSLPAPDTSRKDLENTYVAAQDDLELQLTQIWQEVLGVKPIGIKDNFYELGGHSLLAVKLFSQIEQKLDKHLPLVTLFKAPTIEQLADLMRQDNSTNDLWDCLVPLQPEGFKPALFCMHGAGFNVLIYRQLSQHLGNERPVYALQARGLDNKTAPHNSIEEMAEDYVERIRTVQPEGPYFVAGLSFGGIVALEVAQQLKQQGHEVGFVGMFDTYGPQGRKLLPPIPRFFSTLNYIFKYTVPRFWRKMDKIGMLAIVKELSHKSQKFLDREHPNDAANNKQVQITSSDLSPMKTEKLSLENLSEKFRQFAIENSPLAYAAQRRNTVTDGSISSAIAKIQSMSDRYLRNYRYKPYDSKIVIFKANEQIPGCYNDPKYGWGEIALGELEIYDIPGFHVSIAESPFTAEKLADCLKIAEETS